MFRRRFVATLQAARIPDRAFLPSSFRPGGATTLFQAWHENIPKLQWRGRWQNVKILERYVQELQAINVLSDLSADALYRVQQLAPLGRQIVLDASFSDFFAVDT